MFTRKVFQGGPTALVYCALVLAGCPGEEPPGTTISCGPNTTEVDGKCVSTVDEAPCADGASRNPDTGQCEPDVDCGPGTTYDAATGVCTPDSVCGAGTTLNDATGECEPDIVCGDDTTFDPETGTCLPDVVCGGGTHLDEATGRCVADQNCGTGTTFDPLTGTCVPDLVCGPGLTNVEGTCLSALDLIVTEADALEGDVDHNDPVVGGTPEPITLEPVGESTVFGGNIDRPVDLDSDGTVDQDRDVWSFTAESGTLLRVRVVTSGAFQPGFTVTGPSGYYRESAVGFSLDADREVVLPFDGEYHVTVLPGLVMTGASDPVGDADAPYAAVIERLEWPTPTTLTLDPAGELVETAGSLLDLSDNFINLSGTASAPLLLSATTPTGNTTPALLLFTSDGTYLNEIPFDSDEGIDFAIGGSLLNVDSGLVAVMDWRTSNGIDVPFTLDANVVDTVDLGAIGADDLLELRRTPFPSFNGLSFLFEVPPGQVVLTDFEDLFASLALADPNGSVIFSGEDPSIGSLFYSVDGGQYRWVVANGTRNDVSPNISIRTFTPHDAGVFDGSAPLEVSYSGERLESGTRTGGEFVLLENTAPAVVSVEMAYALGQGDLDVYGLDESGVMKDRRNILETDAPMLQVLRATSGRSLVRLAPMTGTVWGPSLFDWHLDVRVTTPPAIEVEPNGSYAEAHDLGNAPARVLGQTASGDLDVFVIRLDTALADGEVLQIDASNTGEPFSTGRGVTLYLNAPDTEVKTAATYWAVGEPTDRLFILPEDGAGPFVITVEGDAGAPFDYVLEARRMNAGSEVEPNNTRATANVLETFAVDGPPLYVVGRTKWEDSDYFELNLAASLPAGVAVRISVNEEHGTDASGQDTLLRLYDSAGTELTELDDHRTTVLTSVDGTGPLYLEIEGPKSDTYEMYGLRIDAVTPAELDPIGSGEQLATALPTLLAGESQVIWGNVLYQDHDQFEVPLDEALAATEVLVVRWEDAAIGEKLVVTLSDAASNTIATNTWDWGELVARPSGPGPFYVDVAAEGGDSRESQLYRLEVARVASDAVVDTEPNDTLEAAQAVATPGAVSGAVEDSEIDAYSVTLASDLATGAALIVDGASRFTDIDTIVRVKDADGVELASVTDRLPLLEVELPVTAAGTTYYVEVEGHPDLYRGSSDPDQAGRYDLTIDVAVP